MDHNPRFLKLVNDVKPRIREVTVDEVKAKLARGEDFELVDVRGTRARHGVTRPLGGLALADISGKSVKKAEKFVKKSLNGLPVLKACEDRNFYAVGGTWR